MKLNDKKQVRQLTVLFTCTYMVSYVTRTNFAAIISEMETATAIPKSILSIALTGSFITYGTGQIVSGILGDRISPKRLVSCGLLLTVLMNLLVPVCGGIYPLAVVWCINGFAQSFMWSPLVRIMTELLSGGDYKNAVTKVCWGSSFGTILVYLISPLIISVYSWKGVFLFSALCGVGMLLIWKRSPFTVEVKPHRAEKESREKAKFRVLFHPAFIGIMLVLVLEGMLRDGVTTWMPSYISETYHMNNVVSILTGVVLPIFSVLCYQAASKLYIKSFRNPVTCASVFWIIGAFASLVLWKATGQSVVLSVLLSALLTGCMHGVTLMLGSMTPPFFQKYGNVSMVTGILNACCYIGSAVFTYGVAVLAEAKGWHATIFVWFLIALAGALFCLGCARPWKRKFMDPV